MWPTFWSGQSPKFQILGMMVLYRSEISCWWWKHSTILNLSPCTQKRCSLLPWYTEFPVYFQKGPSHPKLNFFKFSKNNPGTRYLKKNCQRKFSKMADIFKMAFVFFWYENMSCDRYFSSIELIFCSLTFNYIKIFEFWTTLTWGCCINFWLIND
jgi:hypothetical protein